RPARAISNEEAAKIRKAQLKEAQRTWRRRQKAALAATTPTGSNPLNPLNPTIAESASSVSVSVSLSPAPSSVSVQSSTPPIPATTTLLDDLRQLLSLTQPNALPAVNELALFLSSFQTSCMLDIKCGSACSAAAAVPGIAQAKAAILDKCQNSADRMVVSQIIDSMKQEQLEVGGASGPELFDCCRATMASL
ncbi:hypothetical protein BCR33DRAFT_712904, partial [Rhizoclosmatium globosum]